MSEQELDDDLAKAGYKYEFEYGEYDYSWTITKVYTRDGKVFDLSDSGCSCNHYGSDWTVDDAIGNMEEVTRVPSMADIKEKSGYGYSVEAEAMVAKYRDLGLR